MKFCKKCHLTKSVLEFTKNKKAKDGLRTYCKACNKISNAKWHTENPDYNKNRYQENPEKQKQYSKKWNKNNPEKKIASSTKWRNENREKTNENQKHKLKTDPVYRMLYDMRLLANRACKLIGINKTLKTYQIFGCTDIEFKEHIENQFIDGMTWQNKCEWHLDHIIPLSIGKTVEDIISLTHYSNFQPLWAIDNLSKKDKITQESISKITNDNILQIVNRKLNKIT